MFTHPADVAGFDFGRAKKAVTALAIVAAGAGLGFAIAERGDTEALVVDAMAMRGAEMANHLESLINTGQAQIAAMREPELLRQRINTGQAQLAAMRGAELIRQRVNTGQAQIAAMREAELLRQRINTGLIQKAAIDARYR